MGKFTHLHVHSHYSVLDGMCSVSGLVERCQELGMNALALTDHGVMYGIREFYDCVKGANNKIKDEIEKLKKELATAENDDIRASLEKQIADTEAKIFKPIFGCEAYVARITPSNPNGSRLVVSGKENMNGYHLILLCKNEQGYKNLCKIISAGFIDGFYGKPRIDRELLEKYHEGLIVASACLGGELNRLIDAGDLEGAEAAARWYQNLFGEDYYIELQRHKTDKPGGDQTVYAKQQQNNPHLIDIARKLGLKLIATNDVHFIKEEHSEAHDHLICLSTGKDIDDPNRMHYSKQEWLKSTEEMEAIFADIPEAITNTQEIVDKVEVYSLDRPPIMPVFPIPEDFGTVDQYKQKYTEEDLYAEFEPDEASKGRIKKLGGIEKAYRIKLEADYLRKLAYEGMEQRYGENPDQSVVDQVDFELKVMRDMGFPGYFLIVQDFINAAREMGVSVGPGRGSAAGSVVAYCLKITDIDPLKYDLLFERFLNPDRISLPDIDIDFDDKGRGKVLEWVTKKYGMERVAHIITYGTMATKSSIKDVARVEKMPLADANKLADMVPAKFDDSLKDPKNGKLPKVNIKNCLKYVPEMKDIMESDDQEEYKQVLNYAGQLEGTVRQTGVHACGVIIGADDLTNFAPLSLQIDATSKEKVVVTQYEGSVIENVGLIKMDFLGLKNLSTIKEAVDNIKKSKGIDVDISAIPIDDELTFKLYCEGRTISIFQFESPGMQKYLKQLHPTQFEDLIAMNALYRPGPMDYIPQFIRRKRGDEPITYDLPVMERYLKDTYGITVYQEQVMLLSRLLSNFTRGESDTLRKAMGKKQRDKLDHMKPDFIERGVKNGHPAKVLEKIWSDWEKFASYAFNKSHATCYSWVSYQTAYLKAHYPAEYMAASMTTDLNEISRIALEVGDCKQMGIDVLGPDINESDLHFTVNKSGQIRFGLAAISGIGESVAQVIVDERTQHGEYKDIFDFVTRIPQKSCNKKVLESLAASGAFDGLKTHRAQFFFESGGSTFIEKLTRYASEQANGQSAQASLFGEAEFADLQTPALPECEPWNKLERAEEEKRVTGFYLSGHPLEEYRDVVDNFCNVRTSQLKPERLKYYEGREVMFGGMLTKVQIKESKDKTHYAYFHLQDFDGDVELSLFKENFQKNKHFLENGLYVWVRAKVQPKWNKPGETLVLQITQMMLLAEVMEKMAKQIELVVEDADVNESLTNTLSNLFTENKGEVGIKFKLSCGNRSVRLASKAQVFPNTFLPKLRERLPNVHYNVLKKN